MSVRIGTVAGISARVFRVSFTGELSYEINVPARHGAALWRKLLAAGEEYEITPFGTEALHVLRAEKGYIIVGQDSDGTVTPGDLGMDWLVSKKKKADFIGKRSLELPDMKRSGRKQLVGLLAEDASFVLPEGSPIVAEKKKRPPMKAIGHVTSSYFSVCLDRSIALALLARGRERLGETVSLYVDGRFVSATVTAPRFYDPDGDRLRG